MDKIEIGKLGENYAEAYLVSQGFQILIRNFHSRYGEIDIIALEDKVPIFFEVKTRTSTNYGHPEDAVNQFKIRKILKTALCFLISASSKYTCNLRIDVIAVELERNYKLKSLNHFKNILDG